MNVKNRDRIMSLFFSDRWSIFSPFVRQKKKSILKSGDTFFLKPDLRPDNVGFPAGSFS